MDAFKMESIKNSFAVSGLIPFCPERVLKQLNIQLKTPTPPGSWSTNSEPQTPHNLRQLVKQASTTKRLLRQHTNSPPTPSKTALNQLVKGCEMAMSSAIILAKENQDLHIAHEKRVQKRKHSNKQIAIQEGLSIEGGQSLLESRNQAEEAIPAQPAEPAPEAERHPVQAPPKCSDCHMIGHKQLQCPNCHSD